MRRFGCGRKTCDIQQRNEMVGRRHRQRVIVMSGHGENVGRIAHQLRFDGVVETMRPVETLVDLPAIDEAQVVHDVAAGDDQNAAFPQRREARRDIEVVGERFQPVDG